VPESAATLFAALVAAALARALFAGIGAGGAAGGDCGARGAALEAGGGVDSAAAGCAALSDVGCCGPLAVAAALREWVSSARLMV
jgi:hypothetical protein